MAENGRARAVLALGERFEAAELRVEFQGWDSGDGRVRADLPQALTLTFPRVLSPSAAPLLPVMLSSNAQLGRLTELTLHFLVEGEDEPYPVSLTVELPRLVAFELEAPERVLAFRDRSTLVPLVVRNSGNTPGRVELSFSGVAAKAPATTVAPGSAATIHVELPALTNGNRTLAVTLEGGADTVRKTIYLTAAGTGRRAGYGLLATVAADASATLGQPLSLPEKPFSVSFVGSLSRNTYLELSARGIGFSELPEPRLLLRYRNSSLELTDRSVGSPAGNVGRGLYLSQRFTRLPFLGDIVIGAAIPLERADESPRFGVVFEGPRLRSQAALNIAGDEVTAEVSAGLAPFHASLRFASAENVRWRGRAQYATSSFGLEVAAELLEGGTRVSGSSRYKARLPGLGPLAFSLRAALDDWTFSNAALRASAGGFGFGVRAAPQSLLLNADQQFAVGSASFRLAGELPLLGAGTAVVHAGASLPVGPVMLDLAGRWTDAGTLEAGASADYTALLPSGTLTAGLGLEAPDLLADASLSGRVSAAYSAHGGFSAKLGLEAPIRGEGGLAVGLGVSYSTFIPTSRALASFLDGPDPTERRVQVEFEGAGGRRGLPNVRLLGCGQPESTDSTGSATLRGRPGECEVRVDEASLPPDTFVADQPILVQPGGDVTLAAVPTSALDIVVRYRDRDSGELRDSGRARDVRVLVQGPVSRWASASLPLGSVRMTGLPAGEYTVGVSGERERLTVDLGQEDEELLLTVPAPRRTVLDPSAITPPVRLELASLLTGRDQPIRLVVTSPAPIARVRISAAGASTVHERPDGASGTWTLEVPVPPVPAGALNLEVTIEFEEGQVAQRTVQAIVTGEPAPAAETKVATAELGPVEEPASSAGEAQDRPVETRPEPGEPEAIDERGRPLQPNPVDPKYLVSLPGSDELLSFRATSATVPPGITLAVYVTSTKEISSIRITNLRHLQSSRERQVEGRQLLWVLSISPLDAAERVDVPIEVTFTDGLVERRIVSFEVDRYAPIPLIPGYNVPLPAPPR